MAIETIESAGPGTKVLVISGEVTELDITELSRRLCEDEVLNVCSRITVALKDGTCGRVTWVDADGYVEFDAADDHPLRDGREAVAYASEIDQLEVTL